MKISPYSSSSTDQEVRIELIPLIDVIFCILTFFILAAVTLTRQTAISVDLPQAETGTTQLRETLIVSVDPIGQTYVEQQPVTRSQLRQVLFEYQQVNPEGLIVLYASRSSTYNDVVEVLDLLRSIGGDRVALATLPEGTGAQQPGLSPDDFGSPGSTDSFGTPGSTDPFGGFDSTDPFNPTQPSLPGFEPLPTEPGQSAPDAPATPAPAPGESEASPAN